MIVVNTPITDILVLGRVRHDLGELADLVESIKEKGIIQPITINQNNELVAGGRRLAASKLAGLTEIPAIVRYTTDELDHREIELFENVHRKELTWQEHLAAVERIHAFCLEKHGAEWWSSSKTARLVGMLPSTLKHMQTARDLAGVVPGIDPTLSYREVQKEAKRRIEAAALQILVAEQTADTPTNSLLRNAQDNYIIGDALTQMTKLTPGMFNFAEVDPPYAVDITALRQKSDLHETYNEITAENYPAFITTATQLTYRALSDNSFAVWWFPIVHHELVRSCLTNAGFKVDNIPAIWYKTDAASETNDPNTLLASSWEPFFICRKGQPAIRQRARSNVFAYKPVPPNNRGHLAERPVSLIGEILDTFVWPSARVLVPFLGSGNTLLAAYERQLSGVGWDLDQNHKDYFLLNVSRLSNNVVPS